MYSLIISTILALVVLISSKSIYSKYINILLIFFISSLIAVNRGNQDYDNYVDFFNDPNGYAEPGYVLLVEILKYFGSTGHESVLLALSIFFFYTFLRLNILNKFFGLVLFLYFVFPFPIDVVQIRNTFLLLFLLNSLVEYVRGKNLKSLVFVFFGASFHYLGFLFLLIPVYLKFENSRLFRIFIKISPFIIAILGGFILANISEFMQIRNLESYIADNHKIRSPLVWGFSLLLDIFIFRKIYQKKIFNYLTTEDRRFYRILYLTLISGIPLLGFLIYLDEFGRYFRILFFAKYFLTCIVLNYVNKTDAIKITLYSVVSAITFAIYYNFTINSDAVLFNISSI